MKKMSSEAQDKIATFLTGQQVRPLERQLYLYHFGGGSVANVLVELARFQNADGGFGHGLEPDLRLAGSSVIATTIAFQHLREIHAPIDHPVLVNGCRYLCDTYDVDGVNWPIIPPDVDESPHAPWWVYGGDLSRSLSNPRAEILGYLYEYPDHFPAAMRQSATDSIIDFLLAHPDTMEMHDFLCAVRLYETALLPDKLKTELFEKLKCVAEKVVARDPASWTEYGLPPLSIINMPDSAFAPLFRRELEANLDYLIDQCVEAGYWNPNWSWGGMWPDAWAQAEREWRGVLTLKNLCILRAFGRLE